MYSRSIALSDSTMLSRPGLIRARTTDSYQTYDQATVDSTGAFLISELERLDPRLHEPLVTYTWARDIDLRGDVTVGDELSSFTNSTFASAGGIEPGGKAWIGRDVNAITGIALDIGKTAQPLHLWGMELSYTLPELAIAAKLGRPIDTQKFSAMQIKWNMDIDEQVYIGDAKLGAYGITNLPSVTPTNVLSGTGGTLWSVKTPTEILADINLLINAIWLATGYARAPTKILMPPVAYSRLVSTLISTAGSQSIMSFLRDNSLANQINGTPVEIVPVKWLTGRGVGGLDRVVAYTQDENLIRFPMTALQRTPVEYRSLYQITTYWGRIGQVETPYPEVIGYLDGV
jgi:hypothetical protein